MSRAHVVVGWRTSAVGRSVGRAVGRAVAGALGVGRWRSATGVGGPGVPWWRAAVGVVTAMIVSGGAAADASTGAGSGTNAATTAALVLAALTVVATALSVTRVPDALPFAGVSAGLAWVVALAVDGDHWWAAPFGGLGIVALLLVAAPTEVDLDRPLRRLVLRDRLVAFAMGVLGVTVAAVVGRRGDTFAEAIGASAGVAALVVLGVLFASMLRRVTR